MINLVPGPYKESLHYARRNTVLIKWIIALIGVLLAIGMLLFAGKMYLSNQAKHFAATVESTKQNLARQNLEETKNKVENISSNLNLIDRVLSKQVVFSALIKQVGAVMPEGTVLSNIEISKVQGGIDLEANAQDYTQATQVQVNLQDPQNKLFDKVDIIKVDCPNNGEVYACTVKLRALFTKNNPYLYITQGKDTQQ